MARAAPSHRAEVRYYNPSRENGLVLVGAGVGMLASAGTAKGIGMAGSAAAQSGSLSESL